MILIFIGMPGSGKGTQAAMLVKKLGFSHISLGDILRSYSCNGTEFGNKIKNLIDEGKLIGDDIVSKIIIDEINDSKKENIILDGYPRTLNQLNFLEEKNLDKKIILVYFKVQRDKLLNRLLSRLTCLDCNKSFSESDLKEMDYVCDECGSKNLIKRDDDEKVTINKRMEVFDQKTYPIIDDIIKNPRPFISLIEINGEDSVENINKILCDIAKTH